MQLLGWALIQYEWCYFKKVASLVALVGKNFPAKAGEERDAGSIPGSGRSLEMGMATHSSVLA